MGVTRRFPRRRVRAADGGRPRAFTGEAMPSMTRHLGVALLAAAGALERRARPGLHLQQPRQQGLQLRLRLRLRLCLPAGTRRRLQAANHTRLDGPLRFVNSAMSCACQVSMGNTTVNQTVHSERAAQRRHLHPDLVRALEDAGDLIIADFGPPPVPDCRSTSIASCGNHCVIDNGPHGDGGFHCVSFADAGGPTGGTCSCTSNTPATCVSATCGCTGRHLPL